MFLTLLALAAALVLLEEGLTRLVPRAWRAVRWGVLPLAGILVVSFVPMGLIPYPAVMDQAVSMLFGLCVASIVALHGMFRDAHWPQESAPKTNGPIPPHKRPSPQASKPRLPNLLQVFANWQNATSQQKPTPNPTPRPTTPTARSTPAPGITVPAILPIPPKNAPTTPPQATPHFTPKPGAEAGRPLRPSIPDPGQKAVRAPMRNRP